MADNNNNNRRRPQHEQQLMSEYGMTQEEVSTFATQVFASQQRLLANTYIPMPEEQIAAIYAALW